MCQVWPGIELDIAEPDGIGHLIIVSNPSAVSDFSLSINALLGGMNPNDFSTNIEAVLEIFHSKDVIYIPHYNKASGLSTNTIEKIQKNIPDPTRVILETSCRSLGIFSNHGLRVISGSDVRDWSLYEKYELPELRFPVSTFSQFCLLIKKDPNIIETLMVDNKKKYTVRGIPYPGITIEFPLYQDVNIFFGQKGTGKTKILESIRDYFLSQSISSEYYSGGGRIEEFKELLDTSNIKRSYEVFEIDDCKEEIEFICKWREGKVTSIQRYTDHFKTKDYSSNKKLLKITDTFTIKPRKVDRKKADDYSRNSDAVSILSHTVETHEFFPDEEKAEFERLFRKIITFLYDRYRDEWIESQAIELANNFIIKIKEHADANTGTTSRPEGTGFYQFAVSRFSLYVSSKKVISRLASTEVTRKIRLGEIEGKGELYILEKYRFWCKEADAKEFKKHKTLIGDAVNLIKQIAKNFAVSDVFTTVTMFCELCRTESIIDISFFIGVRREIALFDGTLYSPSDGEKGILLFQRKLQKDADAYILDEPELGMGNSYINNTIIPRIQELAKRRKIILIATHNANIAVRTLPYVTVFREHSNGEYKTYVGNPFSDRLVDIHDDENIKNWTEESMHTLEGGKEAFYERKGIYES